MGYIFAILSAVSWASGTISFKKVKHEIPSYIINLYKNILGFMCVGSILFISVTLTSWDFIYLTNESMIILIFNGIIGTCIAEQLYIKSISMIGANLISILGSSLAVFIFIFAFGLNSIFGPSYFPTQIWPPHTLEIIGCVLIIISIIYSSWDKNLSKYNKPVGVVYAMLAFMLMGLSANLTNCVISLNSSDSLVGINRQLTILWILFIRFIPAILFQLIIVKFNNKSISESINIIRKNKSVMGHITFGSTMLSFMAITFLTLGIAMESNNVTLFSLLAQTSNIFIFLLGWFVLKEVIDRKKVVAIAATFIGIIFIGKNLSEKNKRHLTMCLAGLFIFEFFRGKIPDN